MILHDYKCRRCGNVTEHFVSSDQAAVDCGLCLGIAERVFLVAAKPDWLALAQGSSASPEAIDKFERMHKKQAEKETKCYNEHGDYGPRPGAD